MHFYKFVNKENSREMIFSVFKAVLLPFNVRSRPKIIPPGVSVNRKIKQTKRVLVNTLRFILLSCNRLPFALVGFRSVVFNHLKSKLDSRMTFSKNDVSHPARCTPAVFRLNSNLWLSTLHQGWMEKRKLNA